MIKKYYFKNQLFLIILILFGVIHSSYFFFHHQEIEKEKNYNLSRILNIHCRSSKQLSSVKIEIKRQKYFVKISNSTCFKYRINDTLKVLYDKTFDKYFISGRSELNLKQLKILLLILLIFFLPWQFILRKTIIITK